tara:strand:- start:627 stop:1628 length:1002 start_codon:yes stop_codon:yes gene_type:complete
MKKYDIFGVGNALVDIEYSVSSEDLKELGLPKGAMTIVSDQKQRDLFRSLNLKGLKETSSNCGGSAANTITTAAMLGSQTYYSCRVANDSHGDFFCEQLSEAGISNNLEEHREKGSTGTCLTLITEDAERTMATYLGVTEKMSKNQLDFSSIEQSKIAYIEGYLVSTVTGFEAALTTLEIAKKSDTFVSLTLSDSGIVENFRKEFETLINKGIDLLFCNFEEAKLLTRGHSLKECEEQMKEIAPKFVITLGNNGACTFDGEKTYLCKGKQAKAIDTTGAGDTFAGAFLHSINLQDNYERATQISNIFAGEIVSRFGARLPKEITKNLDNRLNI